MENNNYGSLHNENPSGSELEQQQQPKLQQGRQRFDIAEPNYPKSHGSHCCYKANTDGFKLIVISMFVFAVGVTVALIISIASGTMNYESIVQFTLI